MASNNLIISTLFIYLTTYASLYFAVGAAAARDGDENKIDYGNEEFGSGSSARIDEENLPEIGYTQAGLDDEDYSYMEEQLSPTSHRIVLDLPSPTPAFQFESSEAHFSQDSGDILPTPAIAMVASNNMIPLQPSILSTFTMPLSALPMGSQVRMSSNLNNDWIHLGSGDSIDVAPTPRIDVSSYVPNTMTVMRANSPPTVSKPISKILVPGGQLKKHRVDTHFNDVNDLSLRYAVATADEWIYTVGNEIIMLPTVEDVSEYRFNVTAQDPQGLMARTDLIISVRQPSKSRQWYFYFEFSFPYFYNWREVIFNNMSADGPETFIVTKVKKEGNRINLQYVNETLMEFDACPVEKIQSVTDTYKKIYPDFHHVLLPEKICESFRVVNASKTSNYPPSIKNQIDFINCSAGELFVQKVPDDFCYDPEEGSTANLQLALVDFNQDPLKPNNWLQFDAKNREFYGIYVNSSNDMSPTADKSIGGTSGGKYVLVCSDSHGKSAVDVLDTWISMPEEQYNAEFSLHFHTNSFGPLQIRKFVEKLGSLFNSTSSHIKIKSYTVDSNVVHFTWFNKSNPGEKEITQLRKVLFSNEGPVDKKVVELFSPDYNITGGNIVPTGRLIGEDTVFHFQTNAPIDSMSETSDRDGEIEEEVSVYSNYSGYLVTYIVPSVLIAVMVLLSLIIACLLSRKKKIPGEGSEIRKVGGGVPVIFQDELEAEHPLLQSSTAAPPPPPPHGTGTSGSSRAPPAPSPMYGNNAGTPSSAKYSHPPGYKSVSKYEPPMPPVQYSSSTNKYHHSSNNSGILPPPYVPP